MTVNKLKLNYNKTEFCIAGTTQGLTKLPPVELKVGNDMIKPSSSGRNLGIFFDNHMSMTQHINSLTSSVNFHLRNIRRIAKYLDQDTKHHVVRCLIPSRWTTAMHFCTVPNQKTWTVYSLFKTKPSNLFSLLGKRDSPSLLMNTLHWLPIRERIIFKICMYVFKCLQGRAPEYLTDVLSRKLKPASGPLTRSSADTSFLIAHIGKKS